MVSVKDAEESLNRCREVSSGDIIMPDDINCLVDTANNSISALKDLFKSIVELSKIADPIEYIMDRYYKYHYEKAGAIRWLECFDWSTPSVLILDGADADEVEVITHNIGTWVCPYGKRFGAIYFLKRNESKFIDMYFTPGTTIKVNNPDLIVITKPISTVYSGIGPGDIAVIQNQVELNIKKLGEVVKNYQIDVISAFCTEETQAYSINERGFVVDVIPYCPDLVGFVEFGSSLTTHDMCISALDSTNGNTANVLYTRCFYDKAPYMYVPKGTKMIRLFPMSLSDIDYPVFTWTPIASILPDPELTPNTYAEMLFC